MADVRLVSRAHLADECVPEWFLPFAQALVQNTPILQQHENVGPTVLNGQPASYYLDLSNHGGPLNVTSWPQIEMQLTVDMNSSGQAQARLWVPSTGMVGTAFPVVDIFEAFWYAKAGDRGLFGYHQVDEIFYPVQIYAPDVRHGTLSTNLNSGGTATVDGRTVRGDWIPANKRVPSGSPIRYYAEKDGVYASRAWQLDLTSVCPETIPTP